MKKLMFLFCFALLACGHSDPVIQTENFDRHFKLTCVSEQPALINADDAPAIWLLELDSSEYIICSETYANSIVKHK